MKYFIHPESCSAWTEEDDFERKEEGDPLVEEVSREDFMRACAAWGIDPSAL